MEQRETQRIDDNDYTLESLAGAKGEGYQNMMVVSSSNVEGQVSRFTGE